MAARVVTSSRTVTAVEGSTAQKRGGEGRSGGGQWGGAEHYNCAQLSTIDAYCAGHKQGKPGHVCVWFPVCCASGLACLRPTCLLLTIPSHLCPGLRIPGLCRRRGKAYSLRLMTRIKHGGQRRLRHSPEGEWAGGWFDRQDRLCYTKAHYPSSNNHYHALIASSQS